MLMSLKATWRPDLCAQVKKKSFLVEAMWGVSVYYAANVGKTF